MEGVSLEGTSFPAGSPLAGGTVGDWGKWWLDVVKASSAELTSIPGGSPFHTFPTNLPCCSRPGHSHPGLLLPDIQGRSCFLGSPSLLGQVVH